MKKRMYKKGMKFLAVLLSCAMLGGSVSAMAAQEGETVPDEQQTVVIEEDTSEPVINNGDVVEMPEQEVVEIVDTTDELPEEVVVEEEQEELEEEQLELEGESEDGMPIYRLYNPTNEEHLYTSDAFEKDMLSTFYDWVYEGVAWYAPETGTPIYRLYNPILANHLYTADTNEISVLTSSQGWVADNNGQPLFYSGGDVSVYRVYNKLLNGMHHLTTDANEYSILPSHGWLQEGISFNALKLGEPVAPYIAGKGNVSYTLYKPNVGFIDHVANGTAAGTKGNSYNGMVIWLENPTDAGGNPISGGISYQVYNDTNGWVDVASSGVYSGSSNAMQAIKISLTGDLANNYNVYYRTTITGYGRLDWAKNGQISGSVGYGQHIESVEIKLVRVGLDVGTSANTYIGRDRIGTFAANASVTDSGWQTLVGNNGVVGTTAQNKAIEAMHMSVDTSGNFYSGGICYSLYIRGSGWTDVTYDEAVCGTASSGKRAEAVRINLTGDLAKYCDIWYSPIVDKYGQIGWAKNGQTAGTSGISYSLRGVQVRIVPKNLDAPGTNANYLKTVPYDTGDLGIYNVIANRSSSTNYIIGVDTSRCLVGIYQGTPGNRQVVKQFVCAPGKPSSPTVKGEYTVIGKGLAFGHGYTCWYYTQFYGNYLFHSILYQPGSQTQIQESGLGTQASHGCVRLSLTDAKWIYDNIPYGTKVVIW